MVLHTLLTHATPVASFPAMASGVAVVGGEQLGMLHRAVRSGSMGTLVEVLGWAVGHRACLAWDASGPHGLTPLHLLAVGSTSGSSQAGAAAAAAGEVAAPAGSGDCSGGSSGGGGGGGRGSAQAVPSLAAVVLGANPGESRCRLVQGSCLQESP